MRSVVEETLTSLVTEFAEKGVSADYNAKQPVIWFWQPSWANRKKEAAISLDLFGFVPDEYGRDVGAHPCLWFSTDDFSTLRFRETPEDFGKALRAALPPELQMKWQHPDSDLADTPLGLELTNVTDADRLRLVADPAAMSVFIKEHATAALAELSPTVNEVLSKMTPK